MGRAGIEYGLVAAQVVAGAGLFLPGPPRWALRPSAAAVAAGTMAAGTVVAAAGLQALGAQLTPYPTPVEGAVLRTGGAYGLSRHPVYTGLLMAAGGLAMLRRRPEPLAAAAALAVVLALKVPYEERTLRERFGGDYDEYAARVPALLPLPRVRTVRQVLQGGVGAIRRG